MRRGFTLVELVIVFSIISVIATASIAILDPVTQFKKASDARKKSDLSQVAKAIETYYQDNGRYPENVSSNDFRIKGLDGDPVDWGASFSPYATQLPKDPFSPSKTYIYLATPDGQAYYLYATLDRGNDPQVCNNGNACTSLSGNGIPNDACGAICNFGISSPNVNP